MQALYQSFVVLGSNGTTVYRNNTWTLCDPSVQYDTSQYWMSRMTMRTGRGVSISRIRQAT